MTWFHGFELNQPREGAEAPEVHAEQGLELSLAECRYLTQIEGLDPANWRELPVHERMESLKELEERLAEVQGRPPIELRCEPLGLNQCGYFSSREGVMVLSESLVRSSSPFEAIDTVAHEGRHAYQYYAVQHPEIHDDPFEVAAWAENFDNYLTAEMYGYEAYRNQPIEADAWHAGDLVKGIFAGAYQQGGA